MAHNIEPMDIDTLDSDFDNKENSIHHSNIYPRTPCTEKGYEELDVSELNMKLRYSVTPHSSPMSKSFTANYEAKHVESSDVTLNANLTRSYNSAIHKNDVMNKSQKTLLPLQELSTDQVRSLDSTIVADKNENVTITVSNDIDEHLSLPSSSSSAVHTPEATTPTKDIPKDGGSPIMRGLKSVLNMFRSSQSPIPSSEVGDNVHKGVFSPDIPSQVDTVPKTVLASTPIASQRHKDSSFGKRSSPHRESIVFNDDLEKELLWKDETTILFSEEKIPIHKLFFQQSTNCVGETGKGNTVENPNVNDTYNSTVEYMDISYNDSVLKESSVTEIQCAKHTNIIESDSEFVDCETTFTEDKPKAYDLTAELINIEQRLNETNDIIKTNTGKVPSLSLSCNQVLELSYNMPDETQSLEKKPEADIVNNADLRELSVTELAHHKDQHNIHKELNLSTRNAKEVKSEPVNVEFNQTVLNTTSDVTASLMPENKDILQVAEILNDPVEVSVAPCLHNETGNQNTDYNSTVVKAHFDYLLHENNKHIINSECENHHVPANVPLPDEDDIENEKSLGIDIFEQFVTVPVHMNVVNDETMVIKLENPDLECMPTETLDKANFTNVNKMINWESVSTQNESALLYDEESKATQKQNDINEIITNIPKVSLFKIQTMKEDIAMDINEIISDAQVQVLAASLHNISATENVNLNQNANSTLLEDENLCTLDSNTDNAVASDELTVVTNPTRCVKVIDTYIVEKNKLQSEVLENTLTGTEVTKKLDGKNLNEPQLSIPDNCKIFEKEEKNNKLFNQTYDDEVKNSEFNITSDIISDIDSLLTPTCETGKIENKQQEDKKIQSKTLYANSFLTQTCEVLQPKTENATQESHVIEPKIYHQDSVIPQMCESEQSEAKSNEECSQKNKDCEPKMSDIDTLFLQTCESIQSKDEKEHGIQDNRETQSKNLNSDSLISQICKLTEAKIENKKQSSQGSQSKISDLESVISQMYEPVQVHTERDNQVEEKESQIFIPNLESVLSQTNVPDTSKTEKESVIERAEIQHNIPVIYSNKMQTCLSIDTETEKESLKEDPIPQSNVYLIHDTVKKPAHKEINYTPETIIKNNVPCHNTDINNEQQIVTKDEIEINIDEEIILSKNNSPNVSLASQIDSTTERKVDVEDMETPITTETKMASPPISPKIISKGYNLNFDELDNPFATKTKIRTSPTPDSPKAIISTVPEKPLQRNVNKNRRKSQPERKKTIPPIKKLNSTFSGSVNDIETMSSINTNQPLPNSSKSQVVPATEIDTFDKLPTMSESQSIDETTLKDLSSIGDQNINNVIQDNLIMKDVENNVDVKKLDDSITKQNITEESNSMVKSVTNLSEGKNTSSSEQSFYYSAGTSSGESIVNKNVFNIPEIDDINFNPFVTKSRIQQTPSPPPGFKCTITTVSDSTLDNFNKATENKTGKTLDEKECVNISNTTCSSKTTDEKDITVREVNTEDEDTIEGPFIEADLNNDDKISDFDADDVDMMQFSDLPTQSNEENMDDGELFIDAEAFEFLLNQNKSSVVADSGKESLFLKFDPLFAKRVSSDGVLAALNRVQKGQSTPKRETTAQQIDATFNNRLSIPEASTSNITQEINVNVTCEETMEDLNITVSKPTMVVTPAVNSIVTPRNKTMTPTSSNRRSITFTSPAIAVIDRLLSLSGNSSMIGQETTVSQVSREQNEADLALTQLRELLAEKEINVYTLRSETKDLKDRLTTLESQMRALETESVERLTKINDLNEKLSEKTKHNKSMAAVVEGCERTIASLIAETEQDKKRHNEERIKLVKERDEQTAHLASMEVSFSDLHSKYEKSKQIILICKANEDAYKKSIKNFEENLVKMQSNYELLKQHATSKLNHANQELEKMNRSHESEVLKLSAMIKRKELHITSLEETLTQKTKANEELTAICDELINKVG